MKLLLDENLPHRLRPLLTGHDCATAAFMGWGGMQNGELLAMAAAGGFDALLTKDTNLSYQQDQSRLPLAIVVIRAPSNKLDDIRPLLPALLAALENLRPNAVTVVG
ncbi:DUF5615 family PIN-like protein [Botrimarina sp.]|uniref:DUF5615 family PIN-like protein n=1 Tax=Botrimarina sp. TaxID=2795802 RepID=UPI0032ECB049